VGLLSKNFMIKGSMIALGCVLFAGPVLAQSAGEKTGVNSALGISPTTPDFVKEVAISDMFEIESNKLAQDKGNAPEKKFASQMVTDHTKTSTDLKGLVSSGKVKADLPTELDSSHQSKLDKLKGESGKDFSSDFDSDQVSAHGHMAMQNPTGRANYQPNSFGLGPRESPERGFLPFADVEEGPKRRLRAESFADHYSQARQFYISQTEGEQHHIAAALTFELSKVKTPVIRERMVSHLLNIDDALASTVGEALGLKKMPKPADAAILKALKAALEKEGATFEIVAPKVGGVKASDGSWIEADEMIDGAPSVLYDAVALLPAQAEMPALLKESTARDFVADAFAHCKFIGYVEAAAPLFGKAGIGSGELDEGCIAFAAARDVAGFIGELGKLRVWSREPNVKMK
jgi:predicted outer membrane protein